MHELYDSTPNLCPSMLRGRVSARWEL